MLATITTVLTVAQRWIRRIVMSKSVLIFQVGSFIKKEEVNEMRKKIMAELEEGVVVLPNYVRLVYGEAVQDEAIVVYKEEGDE